MKTLKTIQDIKLDGLTKVEIENELIVLKLVQSEDEQIHISAELNYEQDEYGEEEVTIDDVVEIQTNGDVITIHLDDIDLSSKEAELTDNSVITIMIPVSVEIEIESDNYPVLVFGMQNTFDIANENGPVKVEDCTGTITIKNENGPVKLTNCTGTFVLEQENGIISSDRLKGESIEVTSENGTIKLRECEFASVNLKTENGAIYYECLPMEKGTIELETENGSIHLSLAPNQGYKLQAETEMGAIRNNFMGANSRGHGSYEDSFGDEGLDIRLTTENGTIKISSSDNINGDYLKSKFELIKDKLKDNTEEGVEEASKTIAQLITYLKKMMDTVNEEKVKAHIEKAIAQLEQWKEKVKDPEMHAKVKGMFDSIAADIKQSIHETMKNAKDKFHKEFKFHIRTDDFGTDDGEDENGEDEGTGRRHRQGGHGRHGFGMFGADFGKQFEHLKHLSKFGVITDHEKEKMQDKSRMKILEMLEAGKITAEEAEKLLKAIV